MRTRGAVDRNRGCRKRRRRATQSISEVESVDIEGVGRGDGVAVVDDPAVAACRRGDVADFLLGCECHMVENGHQILLCRQYTELSEALPMQGGAGELRTMYGS